jgi:hypothetical protein
VQLGPPVDAPRRPTELASALEQARERLGNRPAVTVLSPRGREEQAVASLAQWAAKGAHLLEADLLLEPGDAVRFDAPWSWPAAAVCLAAWWAGIVVDLDATGTPRWPCSTSTSRTSRRRPRCCASAMRSRARRSARSRANPGRSPSRRSPTSHPGRRRAGPCGDPPRGTHLDPATRCSTSPATSAQGTLGLAADRPRTRFDERDAGRGRAGRARRPSARRRPADGGAAGCAARCRGGRAGRDLVASRPSAAAGSARRTTSSATTPTSWPPSTMRVTSTAGS